MSRQLVRTLVVLAFTCTVHFQQACEGAVVGYRFGGKVISSTPTPWQLSIPFFSSVGGVFSYDPDLPATDTLGDCDCLGYRQRLQNGYFARLGSAHIRVDEYVIEVLNDYPQESGGVADVVTIRFATTYDPPLFSELTADGISRSGGDFTLNFRANASYLSSAALPPSIDFASYNTKLGFLGDGIHDSPATLFSIESLVTVDLVAGDFDYDNDVDFEDYMKWKSTYSTIADLSADGNHDGQIDAADYTIWRNALSSAISGGLQFSQFSVPEPGASFAIVSILIGFVWWRPSPRATTNALLVR